MSSQKVMWETSCSSLLSLLSSCVTEVSTTIYSCKHPVLQSSDQSQQTLTARLQWSKQECIPIGCVPPACEPYPMYLEEVSTHPLNISTLGRCVPTPLWTDIHLWKHYLPPTSSAGGKNEASLLIYRQRKKDVYFGRFVFPEFFSWISTLPFQT